MHAGEEAPGSAADPEPGAMDLEDAADTDEPMEAPAPDLDLVLDDLSLDEAPAVSDEEAPADFELDDLSLEDVPAVTDELTTDLAGVADADDLDLTVDEAASEPSAASAETSGAGVDGEITAASADEEFSLADFGDELSLDEATADEAPELELPADEAAGDDYDLVAVFG